MRVLLVNPQVPETFWSFTEVLGFLGKKVATPPLGLITAAGLLPGDWEFRLLELSARDATPDDWDFCDILCISGMSVQYSGIIKVIKEGRRRDKIVIVGGPWVYHGSQEALIAGADIVVRGELENAVGPLLEALERGDSGLLIDGGSWPDLTKTPPPRYDLLDLSLYVDMVIQFGRGCPYKCEFCDITLMYGRRVRTKSPAQFLSELQILYDLGWRRGVFVVDDNLVGNPARTKELLRELIIWMEERGHPFWFASQASINLADEPEVLDLMVKAGFYRVFLGLESEDPRTLNQIKKTHNVGLDPDLVCQKINRAGLAIITGFIIGFDGEVPGVDLRLIDFAERNDIPEMFVTPLQAGPGTDLWMRLKREGRLKWSGFNDHLGSQTGLMNFEPTRSPREIAKELIQINEVLFEPRAYLRRVYRHFEGMAPLPFKKAFLLPTLREMHAVGMTILRQGILRRTRWAFWRYFCAALLKLPDRFSLYMTFCVLGEHYFKYRHVLKKELMARLAILER